MSRLKQYHPDELTAEKREHMCPACRCRYYNPAPAPRELYGPLHIDRNAYRWLENAARVFDEQSGEDIWSAADFVAWIKSDIYGERPPHIDHDGAPAPYRDGQRGAAQRPQRASASVPASPCGLESR